MKKDDNDDKVESIDLKKYAEDIENNFDADFEVVEKPTGINKSGELNLNELEKDDINLNVREIMRRESALWDGALKKQSADKELSDKKIDALKKVLLLVASGGLKVKGYALEKGKIVEKEIDAKDNKLSASQYLSGHLGRVYISLPKDYAKKALEWIAGEKENITNYPGLTSYTEEKPVIFNRGAATHGAEIKEDGSVEEKKLSVKDAAFDYIESFLNGKHYGMNISPGEYGSSTESRELVDDGTCGHLYINAIIP